MCVQHSPICMKENRICKLIYTHKIPLKGIKRHWNHWLPLGQDTRCLRNISIWSSSTVNHMNILPSQKKWVKFKLKKEGEGRGRAGECGRNLEMNSCSGPSGQKDAWPRVGLGPRGAVWAFHVVGSLEQEGKCSEGSNNSILTWKSKARIKARNIGETLQRAFGTRFEGAAFYLADSGKPSEAFH